MTETLDAAVVGGGIIGVAVARSLALTGRSVVLLEAGPRLAEGATARNSEVVHAGLYYLPGSLKATSCRSGRDRLWRYCETRAVPHRRLGKLIVATTPEEIPRLDAILVRAAANDVTDLERLTAGQVAALEPEVRCVAALHSPATGIVDAHALVMALRDDAEAAGASFVLHAPVVGGRVDGPGGIELDVGGREPVRFRCRVLVNAAGLGALELARRLQGLRADDLPRIELVKGHYFTLRGPSPFRRLVYPVPTRDGLGVHATLDLAGQLRFGPDTQPIASPDYDVSTDLIPAFARAIRRFWPALDEARLQPGYAGIRTKARFAAEAEPDFVIQGPAEHGVPGLVQLFGIESPGLTAALALAEDVVARLDGALWRDSEVRAT